jgi:hypothetical protein
MEEMMRRILLMIAATLVLLALASDAFSQVNADNLSLSISANKTTFTPGQKAKVRARVENKTGQILKTDTISVSFNLSVYGKDLGKCRFPDCFVSDFALGKKIENGGTFEFEVDLTDLYWNNLIASGIDFRRPKNMFKVIPSGDYHLFMAFQFPDEKNSTEGDPRTITITSNEILIKMQGKR